MPAKSTKQQTFMGMVHKCKKTGECDSSKVKKTAKTMTKKAAKDFASTKHKDLPEKVKESTIQDKMVSFINDLCNKEYTSARAKIGEIVDGKIKERIQRFTEDNRDKVVVKEGMINSTNQMFKRWVIKEYGPDSIVTEKMIWSYIVQAQGMLGPDKLLLKMLRPLALKNVKASDIPIEYATPPTKQPDSSKDSFGFDRGGDDDYDSKKDSGYFSQRKMYRG